MCIYIAGSTPALSYAKHELQLNGMSVTDIPRWDTAHLLLDVPSFRPGSTLNLDTLLSSLPREVTVWGGNLQHSALEERRCVDFLKDESYLIGNAAITADCAIHLITPLLKNAWQDTNTLIIGWGRIGKFLTSQLKTKHVPITIVARSRQDQHTLRNLGDNAMSLNDAKSKLPEFDLIINTAPAEIFSEYDLTNCKDCLKIDLASRKGIAGDDVVWARGLPGIYAPEQSGKLIAKTMLRIMKEEKI